MGSLERNHEDESRSGKSGPLRKAARHVSGRALFIGALIILAVILIGGLLWLHGRNFVSTDDAYTTSHVHPVSCRVTGTVQKVCVDDNQSVRAGDILALLDPRDYEAAIEKARASVAQAEAQLGSRQAAVAQAQAQINEATAQLVKTRLDYERIRELLVKKVESKANFDAAAAALATSQGQEKAAEASFALAQADMKVAQANLSASEANEKEAALNLSYCAIHAPVAGKVSNKTVEEGQRVQPGQELLAVVPDSAWVLANIKETDLGRIRPGQPVDIRIDALSGRVFSGTVDSIQNGSGATFSLLPPDNATGNFIKIVQRVPVKILFDAASIHGFERQIVPGLSVVPRIHVQGTEHGK
jgi:membrane fusion protein (multidrug efflux system)